MVMRTKKKAVAAYPAQIIETKGTITEILAGSAYRALLPNGKPTVAYMQQRTALLVGSLQIGDKVQLSLNPSDFDCARITARLSK